MKFYIGTLTTTSDETIARNRRLPYYVPTVVMVVVALTELFETIMLFA